VLCGCEKKPKNQNQLPANTSQFQWLDGIALQNIPAFSIKGFLGGKEVNFSYIDFERWHGSDDNVLKFSIVKPPQPCGFIDKFEGVEITRKGKSIEIGSYGKEHFTDDFPGFNVVYKVGSGDGNITESNYSWNLSMMIDSTNDKLTYGRIALCFNDESKSWIAGKFEANICNN
jgi:hypothetical protein